MSQAGVIKIGDNILPPDVPLIFSTNSGNASASLNILNVIGGAGITTSGSGNQVTISNSGVLSVSGTANRITSTGGSNSVIDIASNYVGQTSIVTLGTVTTGTWNASTITVPYGGTGLTTLTAHALYVGNGTSAPTALAVGDTGSLLQGFNGSNPSFTTSPTVAGTFTLQGAQVIARTATAISYTVLSTDFVVADTDTTAVRTISLPNAPTTGQMFVIKDESGASSVNNISVTTVGGAVTIDGLTSQKIISNWGSITVYFNGTAYYSM